MPLIPDTVFQNKLSTLPLATYRAGETVLTAASTTGRLLILRQGAVAVVKDGVEIATREVPHAPKPTATVLARRLDAANKALIDLKHQVRTGESHGVIGKAIDKMDALLGASGACLVYAGYPYDPIATHTPD